MPPEPVPEPEPDVEPEPEVDPDEEPEPEPVCPPDETVTDFVTVAPAGVSACQRPPSP